MTDPQERFESFCRILDSSGMAYRLHQHKPVLSYDDADEVREELGLSGNEGKVVVCRTDAGYAVYITTQGNRFNAPQLKRLLGVKKIRIATPDELLSELGAEPGSAYPFGFSAEVTIAVDPGLYAAEVLLFSSPLPTVTLEISGTALRSILERLPNATYDAPPA